MDDVTFVIEVDCFEWLSRRILIDIEQVTVSAVEVYRSLASGIVRAVTRQNVIRKFARKSVCART